MAVVIETTLGDFTVDLFTDVRPQTCKNFLKLCKIKYYNFCLFHSVQANFLAQTGDPTGSGTGGESIFGIIYGEKGRYYEAEKLPKLKHTKPGLLSMVNCGNNMLGSQFFLTLGSELQSLDEHCIFAEITEGMDILLKLNEAICDNQHRPYKDIRITHTVILEDPFEDPSGLVVPSSSPEPSQSTLQNGRIGADEEIDETAGMTAVEIEEMKQAREAQARATILEIVGDLPDAEMAPPENVLFVCKLNPVTNDDDLEIIFSRFGKVKSCEVIRDHESGDSLQYAFIEFEEQQACEEAYFKMDNVLIDDRRIHVDFSQSVAKMRWRGKGKGVEYFDKNEKVGHEKASEIQYSTDSKNNSRRDFSRENKGRSSRFKEEQHIRDNRNESIRKRYDDDKSKKKECERNKERRNDNKRTAYRKFDNIKLQPDDRRRRRENEQSHRSTISRPSHDRRDYSSHSSRRDNSNRKDSDKIRNDKERSRTDSFPKVDRRKEINDRYISYARSRSQDKDIRTNSPLVSSKSGLSYAHDQQEELPRERASYKHNESQPKKVNDGPLVGSSTSLPDNKVFEEPTSTKAEIEEENKSKPQPSGIDSSLNEDSSIVSDKKLKRKRKKSKDHKPRKKRKSSSSSDSSSDNSDSSDSSSSSDSVISDHKSRHKHHKTIAKKYYRRGKLVKIVKKRQNSSESDSFTDSSSDSYRRRKRKKGYNNKRKKKVVKIIEKRKINSSSDDTDSESSSSDDESDDEKSKKKKMRKVSKKKTKKKNSIRKHKKMRNDSTSCSESDKNSSLRKAKRNKKAVNSAQTNV